MAQSYKQEKGVNIFYTYSPLLKIATIRMLIAVTSICKFQIHQMNVKTTFLNGELKEEIYMKQLEGFVVFGKENKVCKPMKALYGLM